MPIGIKYNKEKLWMLLKRFVIYSQKKESETLISTHQNLMFHIMSYGRGKYTDRLFYNEKQCWASDMAHLPMTTVLCVKYIFSDWPFWHRIQCCICVSCYSKDNSYVFIHILLVSYEHLSYLFTLFIWKYCVFFFFPRHAQLFSNLGEIIAKYSKAITKSMTWFAGFVGNFKPPAEREEFEGESRRNLRFFDEIKWFVRGSV